MTSAHGSADRYINGGCRCDVCRTANTRRAKTYRMRKLAGVLHPHDRVPSIGSTRRIQALGTLGWSMPAIAAIAGVPTPTVYQIGKRPTTTRATHDAIARAYDRIWNVSPPETNRGERIAAGRLRAIAARSGWAPPLAWDDDTIDDPASRPCGVRVRDLPWTVEDFEELLRQGETHEAACRRLGATWKAVEQRLHRAGRNDLLPWAWAGRRIA